MYLYKSNKQPVMFFQQTHSSNPIQLQQRKPHSRSCWR